MGNYLTDIAIVIPALNPCERMVELVRECKDAGFENIILVDDGSSIENRIYFKTCKEKYNCRHPLTCSEFWKRHGAKKCL